MQNSMSQAELHRKSIAQMKVGFLFMSGLWNTIQLLITMFLIRERILMKSILQINTQSVQDMHIYADPSCIPVVRIEQHVMVVPQHCCSKDFFSDASDPVGTMLPAQLQGKSLEKKASISKSGHILRAVIFVHGFQVISVELVLELFQLYHICNIFC
jgi:hypothetical protein